MASLDSRPKYQTELFNQEFGKLVSYFRAKLVREVTIQYYNKVNPYPIEALEWAVVEWISNHKPTAGQLPTPNELASECAMWLNENPTIKFNLMRFDPVEDFDYPIEKLFAATKVLMGGGEFKFKEFCRANRMPEKDVERVESKVRAMINQNQDMDQKQLAAGIG